ncbi:MAG: arsenate reductase (azurin) small subunit [Mariprofundaceae bacterium]
MTDIKEIEIQPQEKKSCSGSKCMVSRRTFLLGSGAAAASTVMITMFPGTSNAKKVKAQVARYPRKKIGNIKRLKTGKPVGFNYPDKGDYSTQMLVKTGTHCGGGVGRSKDVVAFSTTCSHQGGDLEGTYNKKYVTVGQCPFHLSTFDLTKHGMVASGQAYEALPQVVLEVDKKGDIYAIGIMGLLFGRADNLKS